MIPAADGHSPSCDDHKCAIECKASDELAADVTCDGSLFMVRPRHPEELLKLVEPTAGWFGDFLIVEHRYIQQLVAGLLDEGWDVTFYGVPVVHVEEGQ